MYVCPEAIAASGSTLVFKPRKLPEWRETRFHCLLVTEDIDYSIMYHNFVNSVSRQLDCLIITVNIYIYIFIFVYKSKQALIFVRARERKKQKVL